MTSAPKPPDSDTWISGLEPLGPDDDPVAGTPEVRIGPYKLLQKLGEGGMGTVWVAEQTEPVRRRVALKVIKAGMDSEQVLHRFEAERQALALMDHRSIATVLDAGTSETGRPYFVMELVKGVPITKYCDELKAPIRERLKLFAAVCHAIQHAHQKGIIHRDIKPANVLVSIQDGDPVPKVIDFGVAKALHQELADHPSHTEVGELVGTLEYMSPEQAELSALDIDTRADVYALGVMLYVLLAGSTPLDAKRLRSAPLTERIRVIREEDPPKPSVRLTQSGEALAGLAARRHVDPARLTRELRGELDWIVMKALEKDRARRYEAASALARDVERYLQHEPVEACPPSTRYRLGKFLRRHRMGALTRGGRARAAGGGGRGQHVAGGAGDAGREGRRGGQRVPAERPSGPGGPGEPARRGPGTRPRREGTDATGPSRPDDRRQVPGAAADGGGHPTDGG